MALDAELEGRPGPWGDGGYHLDAAELRSAFDAFRDPPTDSSTLGLIVLRQPEGVRATPSAVEITPEDGLLGDRWVTGDYGPDDQISIMRSDIGALVANGQEQSLFGDNLLIDLDLSFENLPTGTKIAIGETLTEVTDKPHNGCAQYAQRFGRPALRLVNGREFKQLRLRGLHVRVLTAGQISLGDRVEVIRG
jgi:MOSC domain-containing protein YiiM